MCHRAVSHWVSVHFKLFWYLQKCVQGHFLWAKLKKCGCTDNSSHAAISRSNRLLKGSRIQEMTSSLIKNFKGGTPIVEMRPTPLDVLSRFYCGSLFLFIFFFFCSFSLTCSFPWVCVCLCVAAWRRLQQQRSSHQPLLYHTGLFSTPVPDCSLQLYECSCYCVCKVISTVEIFLYLYSSVFLPWLGFISCPCSPRVFWVPTKPHHKIRLSGQHIVAVTSDVSVCIMPTNKTYCQWKLSDISHHRLFTGLVKSVIVP